MRIRQHVNPLKSNFFEIDVKVVSPPPGGFLEVELGSAEAHFLIERAAVEPRGLFVGVEIRRELVDAVNQRCSAEGLANVRSVYANISVDLPRLFVPGSVRRFFLNFPDPCWKSRQHKRRVVAPSLMADIHAALEPDGELFVETDIFDIALEAMAELEADPPGLFTSRASSSWSFYRENPFGARSRRERQCEDEGVRIWRLLYAKSNAL